MKKITLLQYAIVALKKGKKARREVLVLLIVWFRVQLTINLTSGN